MHFINPNGIDLKWFENNINKILAVIADAANIIIGD